MQSVASGVLVYCCIGCAKLPHGPYVYVLSRFISANRRNMPAPAVSGFGEALWKISGQCRLCI
jgi:hypothetical protein